MPSNARPKVYPGCSVVLFRIHAADVAPYSLSMYLSTQLVAK